MSLRKIKEPKLPQGLQKEPKLPAPCLWTSSLPTIVLSSFKPPDSLSFVTAATGNGYSGGPGRREPGLISNATSTASCVALDMLLSPSELTSFPPGETRRHNSHRPQAPVETTSSVRFFPCHVGQGSCLPSLPCNFYFPRMQPESSRQLVGFVSTAPQRELLYGVFWYMLLMLRVSVITFSVCPKHADSSQVLVLPETLHSPFLSSFHKYFY